MEVSDEPVERLRDVPSSELAKEQVERFMSTAEKLRQEGEKKGVKKGSAELLLRQIGLRFGEVPEYVVARIRRASARDVNRWAERILTVESLEELFE